MPIPPLHTLIMGLVIGSLSAYLARRRKQNPYLWFLVGAFFGLFGVFALFFAPFQKKKVRRRAPVRKPVLVIQGPVNKFWYYLDGAEQQGPMSHDALSKAWKAGKVNESTYVWHEEIPNWVLLKEVLALK